MDGAARTTPPAELAAVFVGGALGAVARAAVAEALPYGGGWPWATLVVNLAGAFLLGLVAGRLAGAGARAAFLGPGFCGALTTFATLQVELLDMLDDGALGLAAGYAAVSLGAGLLLAGTGLRLGSRR